MENNKKLVIGEIIRYLIVGGIATMFNYFVFFILYTYLNIHYQVSFFVGFMSSVVLGFFINKKWTFKSGKLTVALVIKYLSVYLISVIVGMKALEFFVEYFSLIPQIANVFTIGITTIVSFVGLKYFVFKRT